MAFICAHCGEPIAEGPGHTWSSPIPLPGQKQQDMPKYHLKPKECAEVGDAIAQLVWDVIQKGQNENV